MSDNETKSEIIGPTQVIESSQKLSTVLTKSIRDLRHGVLSEKGFFLDEEMDRFNQETAEVLDQVRVKIAQAKEKRDQAAEAHHRHYDGLINDFQDSIDAVGKLSNPLDKGGGK